MVVDAPVRFRDADVIIPERNTKNAADLVETWRNGIELTLPDTMDDRRNHQVTVLYLLQVCQQYDDLSALLAAVI